MPERPCPPKIEDFEEWASTELHRLLERLGWDDWAQYRVQVLFNGVDPMCPTPQQRQRQRQVAQKLAEGMGIPLSLLGVEDEVSHWESGRGGQ